MNRRTILAAASAAFFSSACGGGGGDDDAAPRTYAIYGGSWTWGWLPGGVQMAVPPAVRLSQLLDAKVTDYSLGAATLRQAHGIPVPFPDGRTLTVDMLPHSQFPEHFHSHPADVVVFRYGGSDSLLGTTPEKFYDLYCSAVRGAQQGGCIPVIVDTYDHPEHPEFRQFGDIARKVAQDCGCLFVPMTANWPEGFVDDIHAGQDQTDQWCVAMAEALKGLA